MLSWIITRHILFGIVIYSAYNDAPLLIPFTWAPERGHYLTRDAYIVFVGLMVVLQVSQSDLHDGCATPRLNAVLSGHSLHLVDYGRSNSVEFSKG